MNDNELDDLLSNLELPTDDEIKVETRARLGGYASQRSGKINHKKWQEAGKVLGGHIAGTKSYKEKIGIHSEKVKQKYREEWIEPKKGMFDLDFQREKGLRHAKEGKGFHGLSKEETIKNAKKGAQAAKLVRSKPVLQYTIEGQFIKEYSSASDAAYAIGKERNKGSMIGSCCNGNAKKCYGFIWKWKN